MDEFEIRIDPPGDGLQGDLVITVLINGLIVTDDDYCLDVDSFFEAIGAPESTVKFVGGCGVPECCGTGYKTFSYQHSWQWDKFHLDWSAVYMATQVIIAEVERLTERSYTYKQLHPRLPFYCQKLAELEIIATRSST